MFEAVVMGDTHLNGLRAYFKDGAGDKLIYTAMQSVLQWAKERMIKHVIMLGDIFDHPFPTQNDQADFLEFVLSNPEFTFWMIAGNHDYSKENRNSLHLLEFISKKKKLISNLNIFPQPTYKTIDKIPIFFAPWPHFTQAKDEAHLCIGHFTMKGAAYDSGGFSKKGPTLSDLKKRDYWIIGDLHSRQVISDRVEYPGTMYQLFFHDTPAKGFSHIVATIKKGKLTVESQWIKFDPPFLLETHIISDLKEIKKLPKDKTTRLRLLFKEGVFKPKNLPDNVVDADYLKKGTDVEKAKLKQIDPKNIATYIDPRKGLTSFLKAKSKLKKSDRNRAFELVTDFLERRGYSGKIDV